MHEPVSQVDQGATSPDDLAARVAQLEGDNARLVDLSRHMIGAIEQLAILAGIEMPAEAEPARPALQLLRGGTS